MAHSRAATSLHVTVSIVPSQGLQYYIIRLIYVQPTRGIFNVARERYKASNFPLQDNIPPLPKSPCPAWTSARSPMKLGDACTWRGAFSTTHPSGRRPFENPPVVLELGCVPDVVCAEGSGKDPDAASRAQKGRMVQQLRGFTHYNLRARKLSRLKGRKGVCFFPLAPPPHSAPRNIYTYTYTYKYIYYSVLYLPVSILGGQKASTRMLSRSFYDHGRRAVLSVDRSVSRIFSRGGLSRNCFFSVVKQNYVDKRILCFFSFSHFVPPRARLPLRRFATTHPHHLNINKYTVYKHKEGHTHKCYQVQFLRCDITHSLSYSGTVATEHIGNFFVEATRTLHNPARQAGEANFRANFRPSSRANGKGWVQGKRQNI